MLNRESIIIAIACAGLVAACIPPPKTINAPPPGLAWACDSAELANDPNCTPPGVNASEALQLETPVVPPVSGPLDVSELKPEPPVASMSKLDSLLALPATAYALQLISVGTAEALDAFAARHGLADRYLLKTYDYQRVRYVLVYDVYPSHAAATAAAQQLPATLRDHKPWVRKLGPLQDAVRAVQR